MVGASVHRQQDFEVAAGAGGTDDTRPLCVDLDGTLIHSDVLQEGLVAIATRPSAWGALLALRHGRAALKQAVGQAARLDPALLPYDPALLEYLREQRALGRHIVLATAADAGTAQAVADHLGLFDAVVASDGRENRKGAAKAAALEARFGRGGFVYAGDSRADLPVWRAAGGGILVNVRAGTAAAAAALVPIERQFGGWRLPSTALLRAIRPHQWIKNFLVFVPLFVSGARWDVHELLPAVLAFAAFCATASGIYLLNDLSDLAADRQHPRKRRRALASGALPLPFGIAAALGLPVVGVLLGASAGVLPAVALYAAMSIAYTAGLKEQPLVDVFMLAALYTVRLIGGGIAVGHEVSLWLLAFSSFLFLSLALVKRVGELTAAAPVGRQLARRGYQKSDMPILQMFGCSTAVAASLVLALFVQSEATAERYASPALLWGIVPLALFWQCRIWLSTARGYMHDDPIVYAARDWVSWLVVAVAAAVMLAARAVHGVGG